MPGQGAGRRRMSAHVAEITDLMRVYGTTTSIRLGSFVRHLGWEARPMQDLAGYAASALVLVTVSMRSMRWLRITAITSNVAFLSYGAIANLRPILVLHAILLPVNFVRLLQMELEVGVNRRRRRERSRSALSG